MSDQFLNAYKFTLWELKFHVCCYLLKLIDQLLWGGPEYIVDLVYLVELVLSGK